MSFRSTYSSRMRRWFSFSFFFLILLSIFFPIPQSAQAAQVTLAWDPNPEPDVLGYIVHYGTMSRNYQTYWDVGNITQAAISNLQDGGTYYLAVTAYDSSGNESGYSNEVMYSAPLACSYSISPASQSFASSGGSGNVGVTTSSGCAWASVSSDSWILITSNATAAGSGTTYYSVSSNSNASTRTGTLSIAGRVFTVSQSGVSPQYSLNITKTGTGSGTVTNSPTGSTFNAGATITLTAAPNANSTFAGWSGACSGTSPTCTLTMNANASVTATFNLKSFTISATAGANGSISPQGTVSVGYGGSQTFTVTPNSGYRVADVKVDGVSVGAITSYSLTNVTANRTIAATFAANASYSLVINKAGTGSGTVTNNPTGSTFNAGTTVTLTATPNASSTFAGWSGACSGTSPTCTLTMNANASVTAAFNLKSFTITATSGANGSISPSGTVSVSYGGSQNFTISPNSGYRIAEVKVDGISAGAVTSYSFANMTVNRTIAATFAANASYSLVINKAGTGSGTVTNNPTGSTFNAGTAVTLIAAPDANSTFAGWSGACSGISPACTLAMNANASVTATFNLKSFTITGTAGANGSISPQGTVSVAYGSSQTFAVTPNSGYHVADVKVDGVSVGAVTSFLFGAVMASHTIEAAFSILNSQPGETVFALNAGGKVYTDKAGVSYSADKYYQGGRTGKTNSSIAGTEDDALYKSERYGSFSYAMPVPNGNYVVTLKFAEIHWSSANRRIFNVKIGGQEVIHNLDLFAKAGKNQAYDVAIPVSVNDGILRIEFVSVKDKAKISAILIRKAQ